MHRACSLEIVLGLAPSALLHAVLEHTAECYSLKCRPFSHGTPCNGSVRRVRSLPRLPWLQDAVMGSGGPIVIGKITGTLSPFRSHSSISSTPCPVVGLAVLVAVGLVVLVAQWSALLSSQLSRSSGQQLRA